MNLPSPGRRVPASNCYTLLLSPEARVLDLSSGMRDLCGRFRPGGEAVNCFTSLVAERCHAPLRRHLRQVWERQRADQLEVELTRTYGEPLKAHLFSIPAPAEKGVQSFLSLAGHEAVESFRGPPAPHGEGDRVGFMILRADGDVDRLLVAFYDEQMRTLLDYGDRHRGRTLIGRSIYQAFAPQAARRVLDAVRQSRTSGEPRRCRLLTEAGAPLSAVIFVSQGVAAVLAERAGEAHEVPPAVQADARRQEQDAAAVAEMERFIQQELRPGLRALHNLARSLQQSVPEGLDGAERLRIMEQLSAQIYRAVSDGRASDQELPVAPAPGEAPPFVRALLEGAVAVAQAALLDETSSITVVDDVPGDLALFPTYTMDSLQQVLIDLIGEAAAVLPGAVIECSARVLEERIGAVTLEFEVCAYAPSREGSAAALAPHLSHDAVRARPMFKACRRYLKALGREIGVQLEEGLCRYRFELTFGKTTVLEPA